MAMRQRKAEGVTGLCVIEEKEYYPEIHNDGLIYVGDVAFEEYSDALKYYKKHHVYIGAKCFAR